MRTVHFVRSIKLKFVHTLFSAVTKMPRILSITPVPTISHVEAKANVFRFPLGKMNLSYFFIVVRNFLFSLFFTWRKLLNSKVIWTNPKHYRASLKNSKKELKSLIKWEVKVWVQLGKKSSVIDSLFHRVLHKSQENLDNMLIRYVNNMLIIL